VAKVREVESAEALQRHPGASDNEIILGTAAPRAVPGADVERLAAPLGEHLDRVVERAWISGAQFESARELLLDPLDPRVGPTVDLLPELFGNLGENPLDVRRRRPGGAPVKRLRGTGCILPAAALSGMLSPCSSASRLFDPDGRLRRPGHGFRAASWRLSPSASKLSSLLVALRAMQLVQGDAEGVKQMVKHVEKG
jgi:hypothetical protein